MRIIFMVLLGITLVAGVSCGNSTLDKDSEKMLQTALTVTSGLKITGLEMDRKALSISYRQVDEDDLATRLQRWLDLSAVAVSFMEEPRTIIIYPQVEGKAVSRVTIEAGDIASLLIGEISFEQALSRIKVETLR